MDFRGRLFRLGRLAAIYLFWPGLLLVVWGELTPRPPVWTHHVWDKALHFTAYFGLAAMAFLVLGVRRVTFWAVLGLVAFGGMLEILQGYTGRDPDIFDEVANAIGALSGTVVAYGFLRLTNPRTSTAKGVKHP